MTPLLDIGDLTLQRAGRELVRNLTLQIQPGQCWCIIGCNGAGKTTLLRALAGIDLPAAGSIQLQGRALRAWPLEELARQRAWLPQSRQDAFGYRVIDTVLIARRPHHGSQYWESESDHQAALDALALLDVASLAERDVRTLSGGERQRVGIAALIAQDTPLMLLDEPTAALDLAHQASAMQLIANFCAEKKTALFATHDLNLACHVADHALLLMSDGSWVAGTTDEVMQPQLLSACLGHPIESMVHHGRRWLMAL